jgi:mannosyltransferase OCH1-like enzyme
MSKIIHYCWFGGKPLPKLAKKCIKSWKKYLPDYEIIEWNEKNFDINMTDFSRKAYENKKWAFVSDVARTYALKQFGGIYLDTDMEITRNVDFLLDDDFFAGWESKDFVAVGVMGAKKPNNPIINQMYERYEKLVFNLDNMYSFAIPKVLTKILKDEYGMKNKYMENQKLKGNTCVYARDYFYPLSYDRKDNMFTENTCMIHYYDASWVPVGERVAGKLNRVVGPKAARNIVHSLSVTKRVGKGIARVVLYPYVYYRRKKIDEKNFRIQEQRFVGVLCCKK